MIKAKAILPTSLRFLAPAAHKAAVERTLRQGENAAREEIRAITAAWSKPPAVDVRRTADSVTITVDDERWTRLDGGTRPHVITPKNRRFLKFVAKSGETVFARRVNHPGTKARGYTKRVQQKVDTVNLAATFANLVGELTR